MPTPVDFKDYTIDTLSVDFPDAVSRNAVIFGNGYHNVPVRVKLRLLQTTKNEKGEDVKKNVSADFVKYLYLYDIKSNKGINCRRNEELKPDGMPGLYAEDSRNEYTHGIYDSKPTAETAAASFFIQDTDDAPVEVLFYIHSRLGHAISSSQTFQLGAYLALAQESTPGPNTTSSGNDKYVTLDVRPELNYGDPGQWSLLDGGISATLTPDGIELNNLDASQVTFKNTRFSLQHNVLKDNSPVRLTLLSASTAYGSPLGLSASNGNTGLVASAAFTDPDSSTGKQKASVQSWLVPTAGVSYTIKPAQSSTSGDLRVAVKKPMPLFSASQEVNHGATALTVIQGSMVIRNENFSVQGNLTHNTGVITIRDNLGHSQNIQISCDTATGKPQITGKA